MQSAGSPPRRGTAGRLLFPRGGESEHWGAERHPRDHESVRIQTARILGTTIRRGVRHGGARGEATSAILNITHSLAL